MQNKRTQEAVLGPMPGYRVRRDIISSDDFTEWRWSSERTGLLVVGGGLFLLSSVVVPAGAAAAAASSLLSACTMSRMVLISWDLTLAKPPHSIAVNMSRTSARRTLSQSTLPFPVPDCKVPNLRTKPENAAEEFLLVVAALRRVRIKASRIEGTSPQPETLREGIGGVEGADCSPWKQERRLLTV